MHFIRLRVRKQKKKKLNVAFSIWKRQQLWHKIEKKTNFKNKKWWQSSCSFSILFLFCFYFSQFNNMLCKVFSCCCCYYYYCCCFVFSIFFAFSFWCIWFANITAADFLFIFYFRFSFGVLSFFFVIFLFECLFSNTLFLFDYSQKNLFLQYIICYTCTALITKIIQTL